MTKLHEVDLFKGLVCTANRIEYDWGSKKGSLYIASGEYSDMSGCINMFRVIDPEVKHIQTFSGDVADVVYERLESDSWIATLPGGYQGRPCPVDHVKVRGLA